jgi:signal transduction histidine kinase
MLFEDNGHGMSDLAQGSLFQPFSFSSSTHGFGLGLAISADIMRAHGGGIALKTRSPKGSVFAGFLPAAALMSNAERSV